MTMNLQLESLQRDTLPDPFKILPVAWEKSVHEHFSQQSKCFPMRTALVDNIGSWSYEELETRSNQVAHFLCAAGIKSQDVVAIYANRSAGLVVAILGILKAKAAFLILDPSYPAARLEICLNLSKAKALIQQESAGKLPELLAKQIQKQQLLCQIELPDTKIIEALDNYSQEAPCSEVNADDLAYVAFTSGTTGTPKGILGGHRALSHFFHWYVKKFNLTFKDRFCMLSGLAHDPLLRDIFTPLWLGATLYIPSQEITQTPGYLEEFLIRNRVTTAHMTPALASLIIDLKQSSESGSLLSSLRYIFFGGDVLTRRTVERFQSFTSNLTCVNFFGSTETPQAMGYYVIEKCNEAKGNSLERVPIGKGIDDVQLLVLTPNSQLAEVGEVGEIYVRTPYLTKGYIGEESLTSEKYITNPFTNIVEDRMYKTGDLGKYLPDGNLVFIGRGDSQVKIRGYRIELGEVQTTILRHDGVQECIVITSEVSSGDKHLVAYPVFKKNKNPSTLELQDFVNNRLPNYMVPTAFLPLEKLPLTPNGKIDYKALPAPFSTKKVTGPRNELEKQLIEIWEEVLEVNPIGINEDFFALGGHSLLSMRMLARIGSSMGKKLPVTIILQHPTIEQLAKAISTETENDDSLLVPIQTKGTTRPLFLIHSANGNLVAYGELVRELGPEQVLYGIKAKGIDGNQMPHSSIEEMASHYVELIKTVQPKGPYQLLGHSMGGLIVYEMACQLKAMGEEVLLLGMLDTAPPLSIQLKLRPPYIHNPFLQKQYFAMFDLVKRSKKPTEAEVQNITFDPIHLWTLTEYEQQQFDYIFPKIRVIDDLLSKASGKGIWPFSRPTGQGLESLRKRIKFCEPQIEKGNLETVVQISENEPVLEEQNSTTRVGFLQNLKAKAKELLRPSNLRNYMWDKYPWLGYYLVDQKTLYLLNQFCQIDKHLPELKVVRLFEFIQLRVNGLQERIYKPRPCSGRVSFFLSDETPETVLQKDLKNWKKKISGPIERYMVPGDHETLLYAPHVKVLTSKLKECIQRASQSDILFSSDGTGMPK